MIKVRLLVYYVDTWTHIKGLMYGVCRNLYKLQFYLVIAVEKDEFCNSLNT